MDQDDLHKTLFASILSLKKVLDENNSLQIVHPDAVWIATFVWNNPIDIIWVNKIEELTGVALPNDLIEFWVEVSNGATLYYDQKYGQWGYRIYGVSEISDQQSRWKKLFREKWSPNMVAIGEIIDDTHPLIVMYNHLSKDGMNYSLIEGNPLDPIEYWVKMTNTFHEWVDHLVTAQGAKFWDWK